MKRLFDLFIVAIFLPLLLPILLITAWLIKKKLGSPVFFRQIRPGLNGKPFNMIKFRSMTDCKDKQGNLLPDVDRLPAFGRFLRSTSLDELPELWNVFKGDMSLVGPRPLLMEYLPRYSDEQNRRHCVKPGITGWAQINGRNAIRWEEKFALDTWYVDHQSLWLDIKILWLTVKKVLFRDGIAAEGEATMPKFMGTPVKRLAILGASGHGKVAADIAAQCDWQDIVFFDDQYPHKNQLEHWSIIGTSEHLFEQISQFSAVFVAIGNNVIRTSQAIKLNEKGATLVSLIHPKATISRYANIDAGCVVMAGAIINPFARIGRYCIINTSATIDHDCQIAQGVHISPGANLAGNVSVGEHSWVGIGSCVKQGITIGQNVMIGAGAVVVANIENNITATGVPAKPKKEH
jgi:sugar O-acyltransferase (sialic acid O-acetyltransferase NeuD family)